MNLLEWVRSDAHGCWRIALAWDAVSASLAIAVGREVIVPPLCLDSTETEVIAAGDTSASFLTPDPLHSSLGAKNKALSILHV